MSWTENETMGGVTLTAPLMNLVSTLPFNTNSTSIKIWYPMLTWEALIGFMAKYYGKKMPYPSDYIIFFKSSKLLSHKDLAVQTWNMSFHPFLLFLMFYSSSSCLMKTFILLFYSSSSCPNIMVCMYINELEMTT